MYMRIRRLTVRFADRSSIKSGKRNASMHDAVHKFFALEWFFNDAMHKFFSCAFAHL